MAIKLTVFDIAGTTLKDDHSVSKTLKLALSRFGHDTSIEQIDPLMGYEKKYAIGKLLENSPSAASDKMITAIHQEFISEMIRFYEEEPLEAFPNVENVFAALKEKGIKVGINTGFSRDIALTIISRLKWEENNLIDMLVASDEVSLGRPHPNMIRLMRESLSIAEPREVAKVGDTEVDIREGQNAGCGFVVGVTTGIFSREELAPYKPTHIVDDIADIIAIVS